MREIVHIQAGQCGNQIGAKVINSALLYLKKKTKVPVVLCTYYV